jgi:uncharacterized repeat protein (TIGR03803 family)
MLRMLFAILTFTVADAATFTTIYQFGDSATPVNGPAGPMVRDSRGVLYGTTLDDYGSLFSLSPPASPDGQWAIAVLYQFGINPGDGAYPLGVVRGPGGALFGTTASGGAYDHGTAFQIAPPSGPRGSWTETVLWSFGAPGDGETPGPIAIDGSGTIHGVTIAGGSFRAGTAFTLAPASGGAWTETIVHSFGGAGDGCFPASILLDANGTAYGTTSGDCGGNHGTVFSISTSQSETVLYTFAKARDGSYPTSIILGPDGTIYGVTSQGGDAGYGAVFSLTNQNGSWQEAVLFSFPSVDGSPKQGYIPHSLTLSKSGALYGVASDGGLRTGQPLRRHPGNGVLFKLTPPVSPETSWQFRVLHFFHGSSDGEEPLCTLIRDGDGSLYGTTFLGGTGSFGTVFALTPEAN